MLFPLWGKMHCGDVKLSTIALPPPLPFAHKYTNMYLAQPITLAEATLGLWAVFLSESGLSSRRGGGVGGWV